ncbi:TonB-dependent receptor [Spirosoma spitsbergense]|uniref:TonB-dependent receptor n=1 Tax=Spirosoma spitsbergense TaxID=431554 RepID=UPI00037F0403|nr:TonB-dependent receptor [Spirosoma spitsbergense]
MNLPFTVFFYLLLAFSTSGLAQELPPMRTQNIRPGRFDFTVSGRIFDTKTGESLPYAYVRLATTRKLIHTNVDGYFTLLRVPTDTSTLVISYLGYHDLRLQLHPDESVRNLRIELEPSVVDLTAVTVAAQKAEVMKIPTDEVGLIQLTPRNLTRLPNIGERDVFRALQLMPGVSAANESSSGLYVRGGTPDQTLVLYDGFTVYNVDHLYGFFSAFNYNALKSVQLYKGGFDAKYGGRLSGVVELTGKEGNRNRFNVGGDASFLSVNAFTEGPIGNKVTFMVAGRRSFKGPLYQKLFDQFQTATTTQQVPARVRRNGNQLQTSQQVASYFYDLNGRVTFRPTERDQVTLSVYNGQDHLDNSQSITLPAFGRQGQAAAATGTTNNSLSNTDLSNWGNTGSSLKWSRRWSDRLYINTLASYSNYFSERDLSNTTSIRRAATSANQTVKFGTFEQNNLTDLTAKSDLEFKASEHHFFGVGVQVTQNTIDYTYSSNDTVTLLQKHDRGTFAAAYVQDQIRLLDNRLTLKPGLRATYYNVTGKLYSEPRLSATYQVTDRFRLKGAIGQYYQFAKQVTREDISQGNRNFWLLANNDYLPVGSAVHFLGGASYETAGYLFDVEAYAKNLTGVTEYTLRFASQIGRGLLPTETFYTGTGTVRGIDFLVQKKLGDYTGWVGYTYAVTLNNIAAYSDKPYYANQDVRHEFKSINNYHWKRFDFALTFIYASGRPYTSIVGEYSVTLLDGSSRTFTNPSAKNANRFPAYNRLDASVTYTHKYGSIGLSCFNLYNRENVWYKKFTSVSDGQTSQLVVSDITYLGITPNLTLSFRLR